MIVGKTWGDDTTLLIRTPMIEIHKISIEPHMRCSMHKHEHKWNGFYCMAGSVNIVVHKNDYPLTDTTKLVKGGFTAVKPGEYHRFETGEYGADVLEVYWIGEICEDIIRQDHGGVLSNHSEFGSQDVPHDSNCEEDDLQFYTPEQL